MSNNTNAQKPQTKTKVRTQDLRFPYVVAAVLVGLMSASAMSASVALGLVV